MLKLNKAIGISLAILLMLSISACNLIEVNPEVDNKLVVAKVNGEEIIKEEYLKQLEATKQNIQLQYGIQEIDDDMLESIKEDVIESMITQTLLMQKVEENNIDLSEDDDKEIQDYIDYLKETYGGEETFAEWLEEKNITEQDLLEELRNSRKINILFEDLTKDVDATEQEMKDFYDENKDSLFTQPKQWETRHILIGLPWVEDSEKQKPDNEEEIEKEYEKIKPEAEEVLAKIKAGEDFAELAKKYSDDISKDDGGLLPPFSTGQFVSEFEEAVKELEVGEISDLVKTENGYHIIKLERIIDEKVYSYDEKKEEIKTYVLEEKKNEMINDTIQKWKDESDIKKYSRNY